MFNLMFFVSFFFLDCLLQPVTQLLSSHNPAGCWWNHTVWFRTLETKWNNELLSTLRHFQLPSWVWGVNRTNSVDLQGALCLPVRGCCGSWRWWCCAAEPTWPSPSCTDPHSPGVCASPISKIHTDAKWSQSRVAFQKWTIARARRWRRPIGQKDRVEMLKPGVVEDVWSARPE